MSPPGSDRDGRAFPWGLPADEETGELESFISDIESQNTAEEQPLTVTRQLQGRVQPIARGETQHRKQEEKIEHRIDFDSCTGWHMSLQLVQTPSASRVWVKCLEEGRERSNCSW